MYNHFTASISQCEIKNILSEKRLLRVLTYANVTVWKQSGWNQMYKMSYLNSDLTISNPLPDPTGTGMGGGA